MNDLLYYNKMFNYKKEKKTINYEFNQTSTKFLLKINLFLIIYICIIHYVK